MRPNSQSNHSVLVGIICALSACADVDGGAVELSWKLRPASSSSADKFVNCRSNLDGTGAVTSIRLDWTVDVLVGGVVEQRIDRDEWPCGDSQGVTGFVLPAGSALFSIVPVCESGPADAASFVAPAVEQRRVIVGNTVNLGAVELIVQVADCDMQRCICQ